MRTREGRDTLGGGWCRNPGLECGQATRGSRPGLRCPQAGGTHFHCTSSCNLMVPSSVMSTTMTCGRVVKKSAMSHVTAPTASEPRPRSSIT